MLCMITNWEHVMNDEIGSSKSRRKLTPKAKKVVEEIMREAEESKPSQDPGGKGDLEEKIRESESKRLILAEALHASREKVRQLIHRDDREERANPFGVFVRPGGTEETAVIKHHGRLYEAKIKVGAEEESSKIIGGTFHARLERRKEIGAALRAFKKGELLLLDNDLHVVESRGFDLVSGSLATVQQVLNDEKLLVKTVGDESIVVVRAEPLMGRQILVSDNLEYDPDSLFAYSVLPKASVDRLVLEKVPDLGYSDIGGLDQAIGMIRDVIELPHLYPEYFREHRLVPPKGFLLYGPPGCGKTLIAKAVANSLAKRIGEKTGIRAESLFLNVKGPELLNKYVGETEQGIRDLFARARSQASYQTPVIIFFDEMDSMFRVRGSGVSSDMEATIVPQFLAELDGLEALENVVVIGATNREDLIDPAVLRPGRLDRKIRIPRPDKAAAREIFAKYLTPDLPLHPEVTAAQGGPEAAVAWMIELALEEMYSRKTENELFEITYANGSQKILYLQDFSSGAIIANIVSRAKFAAVKDLIETGEKGIRLEHLLEAMRTEYRENEDLPSSSNPAEWFRIIGKGGERVIRVRSLLEKTLRKAATPEPAQETVAVGSKLT
jgi:proteasome-associated ATPase